MAVLKRGGGILQSESNTGESRGPQAGLCGTPSLFTEASRCEIFSPWQCVVLKKHPNGDGFQTLQPLNRLPKD